MSLINSIEHAYAVAIGDLKKVGSALTTVVVPALQKIDASASTIEAVTGLVSPQLANIERTADAVLGLVIKAIEDGQSAVASGGVNVALDSSLVNDIKAIMPAIKTQAAPLVASVTAAKA